VTLPKAVLAALTTERDGLTHSIPLDDYLAARREDPGVTQRLSALYLLELLDAAAERLEALTGSTIEIPTEVREIPQCGSNVHIGEGISRCLRLAHRPDVPHSNGDLRWLENEHGAVRAWWEQTPWMETTLGHLIP
jgi:hypothetical protein